MIYLYHQVREDLGKKGERPLFLEQPFDREVREGGEVTFEVTVAGIPDPEVTWMFNGRELHVSGCLGSVFPLPNVVSAISVLHFISNLIFEGKK